MLLGEISRPFHFQKREIDLSCSIGIALFPVAALSIGLLLLFPEQRLVTAAASWQLDSHILLSLLAYSILGLAVLQAVLLAIQDHHLHNRQPA